MMGSIALCFFGVEAGGAARVGGAVLVVADVPVVRALDAPGMRAGGGGYTGPAYSYLPMPFCRLASREFTREKQLTRAAHAQHVPVVFVEHVAVTLRDGRVTQLAALLRVRRPRCPTDGATQGIQRHGAQPRRCDAVCQPSGRVRQCPRFRSVRAPTTPRSSDERAGFRQPTSARHARQRARACRPPRAIPADGRVGGPRTN